VIADCDIDTPDVPCPDGSEDVEGTHHVRLGSYPRVGHSFLGAEDAGQVHNTVARGDSLGNGSLVAHVSEEYVSSGDAFARRLYAPVENGDAAALA